MSDGELIHDQNVAWDLGTITYQVPGVKYLVPSTWYQALGTKFLVPSTWYQVFGTKYLVPNPQTMPTACKQNNAPPHVIKTRAHRM